jgi:hypothetical protein
MAAVPEAYWPPSATDTKPGDEYFPVTWVSDAKLVLDGSPVVKGLIERGSFVLIYGPSGSGKSFFTADIAQHVATGQAWRGRKCPQGLVVYVASEAGASILKRFVAWRDNRMGDTSARIPLAVLTRGPNLLADVEILKLCDQLKALAEEAGLPVVLVIFDTVSRSIPGGDENKAEDMTMVVKAADIIRDSIGAATAYVHHSGKNPEKGARGHSSLFAAADIVMCVMDSCATVEKVRDGVGGDRFPFTLDPVEIGVDADGDAVMTCLLNASDVATAEKPKKPRMLTGASSIGMSTLREVIEAKGTDLPETSTIPKGTRGVKLDQWREQFNLRYGSDGSTPARQAFYKARESLLGSGAIGISDPWAWVTR